MMEKNVKRIFFTENGLAPSFELEDGTIKHAAMREGYLVWISEDEFKRSLRSSDYDKAMKNAV